MVSYLNVTSASTEATKAHSVVVAGRKYPVVEKEKGKKKKKEWTRKETTMTTTTKNEVEGE